jgi:phosphoadenosine phosphosulfate reductase
MQVTMVKKQLLNGEPCRKCNQAEDMLKARGVWGRIDRIAVAEEGNDGSEGMRLGREHGVDTAPFFIVNKDDGAQLVYTSTLKLMRDVFGTADTLIVAPSPVALAESTLGLDDVAARYATAHPQQLIAWALERFGRECAIAFSGAEDVALIDMAAKAGLAFSVFCLDTGRLHAETYRFIEKVRTHYRIDIDMVSPEAQPLQAFVRTKGLFSFYEDGHQECCAVRKVEPLKRSLRGYRAWISGQRKDQSPSTRADIAIVHADPAFEGKSGALVKLNPVANWSSAQVWSYIRENDVPINALHERGFVSIGCEPCTRATLPGQHEREGRWWWEAATQKECGLHSLKPTTPSI